MSRALRILFRSLGTQSRHRQLSVRRVEIVPKRICIVASYMRYDAISSLPGTTLEDARHADLESSTQVRPSPMQQTPMSKPVHHAFSLIHLIISVRSP